MWSWNRTRLCEELEEKGFSKIAADYRMYSMAGWSLFLSESRDSEALRNVLMYGYKVLKASLEAVKKIKEKD